MNPKRWPSQTDGFPPNPGSFINEDKFPPNPATLMNLGRFPPNPNECINTPAGQAGSARKRLL